MKSTGFFHARYQTNLYPARTSLFPSHSPMIFFLKPDQPLLQACASSKIHPTRPVMCDCVITTTISRTAAPSLKQFLVLTQVPGTTDSKIPHPLHPATLCPAVPKQNGRFDQ